MRTVAAILKHKGYQVMTIEPTATIARVVDMLAEHRIGAVLGD
jgi:predicted CoA-binding protein